MKSVYLDPFADFGFKYLFGREQSAPLLIDLLNAFLKLEKKIIEIVYINTEQLGLGDFDRKAIFDIHCKDEEGNIFIIELQKLREIYFKARSLFYSTFFMDAEEASLKESELWAYYASKKAKWDAYAQLETAKIEAKVEGKVEGAMNSKTEIARLMMLDNEPFEKITKYTGLSVAEIKSM